MKKTLFLLFIIAGYSQFSLAQDLNAYKFVIVPEKFEFLKEPNQFQLNELAKFLFEKYRFEAYLEGEDIPAEVRNNSCEGLTAHVRDNSNMFRTKMQVVLKDCRNRQVFISEEGVSREKEYQASYHEALRKAFESLNSLNYSYEPGEIADSSAGTINSDPHKDGSDTEVKGEVAGSTPAERRAAQQPQTAPAPADLPVERDLKFELDKGVYYLVETEKGYNFYQKEMTEPFASLISSRSKDTFIYSSITNQGVAHFDEQGNLVVEILNKESGSPEVRVYKALDQ